MSHESRIGPTNVSWVIARLLFFLVAAGCFHFVSTYNHDATASTIGSMAYMDRAYVAAGLQPPDDNDALLQSPDVSALKVSNDDANQIVVLTANAQIAMAAASDDRTYSIAFTSAAIGSLGIGSLGLRELLHLIELWRRASRAPKHST